MTVQELEIKKIPISIIKFDESNPNELSEEQLNSLKLTMEKFGYLAPVILNKDFTIIDGEHRVKIYQELGKQEIQAYVIDVDKIDLKILRQLMNKLRGEHNKQKDALEFKSIFESGKLDEFSKLLAQPREEFERILENKFDIQFVKPEEELPEVIEPKSKLGDIWQLGRHKVACMDSSIFLFTESIDIIFTDPPYGIDLDTDWSKMTGPNTKIVRNINTFKKIMNDDKEFDPSHIFEQYSKCKEIFLWGADYYAQKLPIGSWFIWDKRQTEELDRMYGSVFEVCWSKNKHRKEIIRLTWAGFLGHNKKEDTDRKIHPTQKPVKLCRWFIEKFSKDGNVVLDIFLGSGSTLIACEQTNRICYGMEIDPHYVDVIVQRWENYTGKKAVLLENTYQVRNN